MKEEAIVPAGSGPLSGVKVIELAGIGPGPFACMMLADLGAEVVRLDRPGGTRFDLAHTVVNRGRRSVAVDLKAEGAAAVVLRLVDGADAVIEGFRPGVAERLGVGPEACLARNPRLIYGRMTGWGQGGPLAPTAGHDINYIALAGALQPIGPADGPPAPPLNLLGDFGAGGLLLAYGVVCALLEAGRSGRGQVVDAAIVDGAASLMAMLLGMRQHGQWTDERGTNLLDGGRPYYSVYECADGKFVAVGAIEERFYQTFVKGLGLDDLPDRDDPDNFPDLRERITAQFRTRSRDEWAAVFTGTDACVTPVLSPAEAALHPHLAARRTYVEADGVLAPAPAPRFDRTPGQAGRQMPASGSDTRAVLREAGYDDARIDDLIGAGVVATGPAE
jgi:alpha-methylacyl-CoA racemase